MISAKALTHNDIKEPINLSSKAFIRNKYAYYQWLREEAPVYRGKISLITTYLLSRYDDCVQMLKDPRFVRNHTTCTVQKRAPMPHN